MTFRARIKTGSYLHTVWKVPGRIAGYVSQVRFNRFGNDFITGNLEPHEVEVLSTNNMVDVIATSAPPPEAAPEPAPEPTSAPVMEEPPKRIFPIKEEPAPPVAKPTAPPPWAQRMGGKRR